MGKKLVIITRSIASKENRLTNNFWGVPVFGMNDHSMEKRISGWWCSTSACIGHGMSTLISSGTISAGLTPLQREPPFPPVRSWRRAHDELVVLHLKSFIVRGVVVAVIVFPSRRYSPFMSSMHFFYLSGRVSDWKYCIVQTPDLAIYNEEANNKLTES